MAGDFPPPTGEPRRRSSNPDLDWLYRVEDPILEPTRVMPTNELAPPSAVGLQPTPPDPERPAVRAVPAHAPINTPLPLRVPQVPERLPVPPPATPSALPTRKRRHRVRNTLVTLLIGLLIVMAYLLGIPAIAYATAARVANVPTSERPAPQPGTAILFVGSDARGKLTPAEETELGVGGDPDGGRTDTMMILYVAPSGRAVLVSLPRDSYVPIPGHRKNKLNAAFALGGPQLLTQTVEHITGLRIDGYVEVGFGGFARAVQGLDGLDICVKQEIPAEAAYDAIHPGCQRLTPKQALWFVRMRHGDPQGDIGRANRQRQFIAAIGKQIISPSTILNPVKYWQVNQALSRGVGIGTDTDPVVLTNAVRGMWSVAKGNGLSLVVPLSDTNATTDAGSSVLWDNVKAAALFEQLSRGDLTDIERFQR